MKITFDKINKNLDTYDRAYNMFPQIQEFIDSKIEWETICILKLNSITNFGLHFKKIKSIPSKLKVITGETVIDFETLKKKMIKECNRLVAYGSKEAKRTWEINQDDRETNEMKEFMEVKKLLKHITEEEFKNVFASFKNWEKLFPHLYRLEINIYNELEIYINNYLAHHKVEMDKDVFDCNYNLEYYKEVIELPKNEQVNTEMYKIDNSDKILDAYFTSLEKSGSINWKYLEVKLKQRMNRLDKSKVTDIQRINDRTKKIDKIVD